jgi:hypothetical protein
MILGKMLGRNRLAPMLTAAIMFVALAAVPGRAADPFGSTLCGAGIVRPGSAMQGPRNDFYTVGFLLTGSGAGGKATYFTTIGDRVFTAFGKKSWTGKSGPIAYGANGSPIGRFVYAVHTDAPSYTSFGLVRLDNGVKSNPAVCHFGGPTGIYVDQSRNPTPVELYGQGIPFDQSTPARTAFAPGTADPSDVLAVGPISEAGLGDEGAPVLIAGKALGFLNGGVGGGTAGAGFVVSRIGPWIEAAAKALRLKLTLRTAKAL